MQEVIPDNIDEDEVLGRIILHSYHYSVSRGKLRPEAFMPSPSEKNEISTLRYNYTNIDFCKQRGLIIAERRSTKNTCTFIGIAFIKCNKIKSAPNSEKKDSKEANDHYIFSAEPIATPLDEDEKIRADRPIYTTDSGIPSHADVKYNVNIFEEHKPMKQSFKQKVIKPLIALAEKNFYKDSDTVHPEWRGDEVTLASY